MAKGRGIQVPFYVGYDSNSVSFLGSAQQSVRVRILRGFLESDEFGLSGSQSLRLQPHKVHVSITAAAPQQSFHFAVSAFTHTHCPLPPPSAPHPLHTLHPHSTNSLL